MKNEKLFDAISDINEEYIEEASQYKFKKRITPRLVKWGSMAASFLLVLFGTTILMSGLFVRKGAMDAYNGYGVPTPTPGGSMLSVLAYNGALYNVSNEIGYLNWAGIDNVITKEDCGVLLGNLRKTEKGYEETVYATDIELYKYAPAISNTAVFVVRDGEEYMAGLFSNNLTIGDYNDHNTISGLYRRYGITSADHISSVAEVSSVSLGDVVAEKITGNDAMNTFYSASMTMESHCFGREDFRELVTDNMSEEEYQTFLESERVVCIETVEGLKFYLSWYPEEGWLFASGAGAYYKITEEMQSWLDTYIAAKSTFG